jgi:hypothetical protein
MTKILIDFNQEGYETAQNKFHDKENAFLKIGLIAENLGLTIQPGEVDFKEGIKKAILEKYKKQNTLNLSSEKLIQLLEIDLTEFNTNVDTYEKLKIFQEPNKEKYSYYITDEIQVNRWTIANEIKAVFEKATTVAPFIKPQALIGHLYPMFTFSNGALRINTNYIQNG